VRSALALACLVLAGCGSSTEEIVATDSGDETVTDTFVADVERDSSALDTGSDARLDSAVFPPPGTACEYAFFKSYFDKDNGTKLGTLRDETFAHIASRVSDLNACGAKITLGGMLSLLVFEGGGAKVAFFNDRCAENSYDKSATCWNNPKARYSYQYGLAPVHTSNFHPCADVAYTSKMRARLAKAMTDAGFAPTAAEIASVTTAVQTFCPGVTPTMVDYYIVSAHSAFAVPKDTSGNDLANAGKFPFFTPSVVIDLFFAELSAGGCTKLTSDNQAITIFGGADASYATKTKQDQILKLYRDFQTTKCP